MTPTYQDFRKFVKGQDDNRELNLEENIHAPIKDYFSENNIEYEEEKFFDYIKHQNKYFIERWKKGKNDITTYAGLKKYF